MRRRARGAPISVCVACAACAACAACGDNHPSVDAALDAFTGPATLTISSHSLGVVTSTPPGIDCGQCAELASQCTDPPTVPLTLCSADFDAGTPITLALTEQSIYFAASCSSQVPPVSSCSFVLTRPTAISVTGVEALR